MQRFQMVVLLARLLAHECGRAFATSSNTVLNALKLAASKTLTLILSASNQTFQ